MTPTTAILLTIAVLAAFALAGGGTVLVRHGSDAGRGWLMIIAAFVILGNVLILAV